MSPSRICQLLFLLLLLISQRTHHHLVQADVNYAILANKNYPGQCYKDTASGAVVIESESLVGYPGKCANIYCGHSGWALIFTCSLPEVPSGCIPSDYINITAGYPDCCEREWQCNNVN